MSLKDKSEEVYKALFNAIDGNLSYNSVDVPVYTVSSQVPDKIYWVMLSQYNQAEQSTKTSFGYRASVQVEVVVTNGDYIAATSITNQILAILWDTVNSTLTLDTGKMEVNGEPTITELTEQANAYIWIRKLMRINLMLS